MMPVNSGNGTWRSRGRGIALVVVRIGAIVFVVEALIMLALLGDKPMQEAAWEGLLDATLLTAFSTPLIYWLVAKPYQASEDAARNALREESARLSAQAEQLQAVIRRVEQTMAQNDDLRDKLQLLNEQIADLNERSLQRVGADLHDGPAQLLSYAMLRFNRIDELLNSANAAQASKELKRVRVAIDESLREVRNLSAGLSLPELARVSLESAVQMAASSHEEHTNSRVVVNCVTTTQHVPEAVKISIYRFIQEGLANAFRHAGGNGQSVRLTGGVPLVVTVSDTGPGLELEWRAKRRLGLAGVQARIEALGGQFSIASASGTGTELSASFCEIALRPRENEHV